MSGKMASTAGERKFGALTHAAPLIVVLVVWWWQRGSAYVTAHARASVNFQITMMVYYGLGIGYVYVYSVFGLTILVSSALLKTVSAVVAARRAWEGEWYEYRLSLTVLRDRGGEEGT